MAGPGEDRRTGFREDGTMRNAERAAARRKLDKELRYYRLADRYRNPTQDLLRAVRQALGIPMKEIARELKMNRSVIFRLERSQERGTISILGIGRVAEAMGCKVVYAIIPINGGTLEELAENRMWKKALEIE
jgi:ribosome-binding protein aMBF1 (putative translation factor)